MADSRRKKKTTKVPGGEYRETGGYRAQGPDPEREFNTAEFRTVGVISPEIIAFMKDKSVKPTFSYADVFREEHINSFVVAGITRTAILDSIQSNLTKALAEGIGFREWSRKGAGRVLGESGYLRGPKGQALSDKQRAWRLQVIYETNMRTARATGQWQRIQRTKSALPYLLYGLGPSERHRPEHAAWDGLVLDADNDFWSTHMPPNGYGCKCHVRQVTRSEADSLGVSDTPPQEYEQVKVGTRYENTPKGVHPQFAYNPGKITLAQKLGNI